MKKVVLTLLAIIIIATLGFGCASNTTQAPKENESTADVSATEDSAKETKPATQSDDKVTQLSFLTWRSEDVEVYNQINAIFEEQNPNIKINMDTKTANEDEYYAALKTKLTSKNDGVDLFAMHPGQHLNEVSETGKMLDLVGTGIPEYYQQQYVDAITIDGKVYGVPQGIIQYLAFFNKDAFESAGAKAPDTWADITTTTQTLTAKGQETMIAGLGEKWLYELIIYPWITQYYPDNPNILADLESGKIKWTDAGIKAVYQDLQALSKTGFIQKVSEGTQYEQSLAIFAQNKASMLLTGSWSVGGLAAQAPDIKQGYFVIPNSKGQKAVISDLAQLYSINADSPNKDAAIKYLTFLSTPEMQRMYADATIQLSAAKDVVLEKQELNEIAQYMERPDVAVVKPPHLVVVNAKLVELLQNTAAKVYMGEDIDTVLAEAQTATDAMIA